MLMLVVPLHAIGLWPLLFLTGAAVAVCLPSSATLLSNAVAATEQGQVMGTNQALQVGAEALSGLAAGLLAAVIVKLPLLVLGLVALIAAFLVLRLRQPRPKADGGDAQEDIGRVRGGAGS
jgi:DHA1 family tetracycline resistance protein-like MFS transporter